MRTNLLSVTGESTRSTLTTLARLANRRPDSEAHLRTVLSRARSVPDLFVLAIEVGLETGGPLGRVLASSVEGELSDEVLFDLAHRCEKADARSAFVLLELRKNVFGRAVERLERRFSSAPAQKKSSLVVLAMATFSHHLGHALLALDRPADSVAHFERSVSLMRELTGSENQATPDDLATSLFGLCNALAATGRMRDALRRLNEIEELLQSSFQGEDTQALRASIFVHRASILGDLGKFDKGHSAILEGIERYRRLQRRDIETEKDLAEALDLLASHLALLDRWQESVETAQQSVEIWSRLAAEEPDRFRVNLARSRLTIAASYRQAGEFEDALVEARRAIDVTNVLARERPDVFRSEYAEALEQECMLLQDLDRPSEALGSMLEVVETRRRLAARNSQVHGPRLALSLSNLALLYLSLAMPFEALTSSEEAFDQRHSTNLRPDAAAIIQLNHGLILLQLDREEGLEILQSGLDQWRQLSQETPGAFGGPMALALHDLAVSLDQIGRSAEALVLSDEALPLLEGLSQERPSFLSLHADALGYRSEILGRLGRGAEALSVSERGIELRQTCSATPKQRFHLAHDLARRGRLALAVGLLESAATHLGGAAAHLRELAEYSPKIYTPDLAFTLGHCSDVEIGAKLLERAEEHILEALGLLGDFATRYPRSLAPHLPNVLALMGTAFQVVWTELQNQFGDHDDLEGRLEALVEPIDLAVHAVATAGDPPEKLVAIGRAAELIVEIYQHCGRATNGSEILYRMIAAIDTLGPAALANADELQNPLH